MKTKRVFILAAIFLAGCTSPSGEQKSQVVTPPKVVKVPGVTPPAPPPASPKAQAIEAYKEALARHITAANTAKVYGGRPQALLRSVVVVHFVLDGDGDLVRSEIVRSNRDKTTEATALASLRGAAPFPRPSTNLLARGRIEVWETWLFNNDGRFQLRTIAQPQMTDLQ